MGRQHGARSGVGVELSMKTLYDELGVEPTATPQQVKKAYRRRAKKVHPDKSPAATEEFLAVQKAYDVLSDGRRRALYDRYGETANISPEDAAAKTLVSLLVQIVDQADASRCDCVAAARDAVERQKKSVLKEKTAAEKRAKNFREAARRLTTQRSTDPVASALETQAAALDGMAKACDYQLDALAEVVKLLYDYRYKTDKSESARERELNEATSLIESLLYGGRV